MEKNISQKTLAIIGCGIGGLISAKEALENKYDVTLYEKNSSIGGVWSSTGYAWPEMKTNTPHWQLSLESFSWTQFEETYPQKYQVYNFWMKFADHFGITPRIKLNCEVIKVKTLDENKISIEYIEKGEQKVGYFDFVIVSVGNYRCPNYIHLEKYLNTSSLTIIHSSEYTYPEIYRGKTVMIVGHSHSATHIASEVCKSAKLAYNVFRRPHWVVQKWSYNEKYKKTMPIAFQILLTREDRFKLDLLSLKERRKFFNKMMPQITRQNDIPELYIDPKSDQLEYLSISLDYVDNVKKGLIIPIKSEIESIKDRQVFLKNGEMYNIDVIILGTGYYKGLDFLDDELKENLKYQKYDRSHFLDLDFSGVYNQKYPNIAFVGLLSYDFTLQTFEFQAKIAMRYFENTKKQIEHAERVRKNPGEKVVPIEELIGFADRIAEECECSPDLEFIKQVDTELYGYVISGPFLVQQYGLKEIHYGTSRWDKNANYIKAFNRELLREYFQ